MVFSKDAIVHLPDKAAREREVLRVLWPGGRFLASDWPFSAEAETSHASVAWTAAKPLTFAYVTPEAAADDLAGAAFEQIAIVDRSAALGQANREEVAILEEPAREQLAVPVDAEMAQRACTAPARFRRFWNAAICAPAI